MPRGPQERSIRPTRPAAPAPAPASAPPDGDPFGEVLTAMRVRSALYCRMEATAPWGVAFAGSPHAKFGLVTRGGCWLEVAGEKRPVALAAGDCYVVAANVRIVVRDSPKTRPVDGEALVRTKAGDRLSFGGGGAATEVITGLFELDEWGGKPLFDLLPPLVHVRADQAQTGALGATMSLLALETASEAPGSRLVVSRLAEILFVQTIRAHLASGGAGDLGWLSALGDPQLGAAMRAMHRDPSRPWSVESLAHASGMSRSAFALRFKEKVGEAPLEYLTRWRMYRAGCLLGQGDMGLAEIARAVGYESAGAFSRAFQRAYATTPGELRKQRRAALAP